MRVVEIRRFGLEHLSVTERPDPEPGHGQILLRLRAASLNYRDLLTVLGRYNPKQPLPLIPGSDGLAEVEAVGAGVTRVAVGDRVATIFAQGWLGGEPTREKLRTTLGGPADGTLAERMVLDEDAVVHVPGHLSDEEASTLTCAGLTAWSALTIPGPIRPGETVLVQGTGGVSLFGLQFAQLFGARVVVTSSDDAKLERARQLGAWETINYATTPEWQRRVLELTDGVGVDRIVEVGGAGTLSRSLGATRFGGQISMIGVLSGVSAEISLIPILMQQIRIQGVLVGSRDGFETMNRAIESNELRPVVDRCFALEQAREALEYMATGRHFGKIVLTFAGES